MHTQKFHPTHWMPILKNIYISYTIWVEDPQVFEYSQQTIVGEEISFVWEHLWVPMLLYSMWPCSRFTQELIEKKLKSRVPPLDEKHDEEGRMTQGKLTGWLELLSLVSINIFK